MADSKNSGRWKRFLFSLLGPSGGRKRLANIVRKQTAAIPPFSFPLDAKAVKKVLVILPPGRMETLRQLKNVASLKSFFSGAAFTLVAGSDAAPLARLLDGATVVEYPLREKRLFSAVFNGFNTAFHGAADICCLLTGAEDLPLLYLAGRSAAPIRAGYQGAGEFPFINLRVNPSKDREYAADRNLAMAEMLGAGKTGGLSWKVTQETEAEIDHLLTEVRCGGPAKPAGIDALFFYRAMGGQRAAECIRALGPAVKEGLYLYAEKTGDAQEMQWLLQFNLPLIYNISVAQTAGLLGRSRLVVTGNTLLFALAVLLDIRAVGIFKKDELAACCPKSGSVRGIVCDTAPDDATIRAIALAAAEFAGDNGALPLTKGRLI